MKFVLTSILSLLIAVSAFGETLTDSIKVSFAAGSWLFDPMLSDNRKSMDDFLSIVRGASKEDNIEKLVISGFTSPEGSSDSNYKLAAQRCNEIANLIMQDTGLESKFIQKKAEGVAWSQLRRLVAENPNVPAQKKVLDILDNTPLWVYNSTGQIVDGRKKRLMEVGGGSAWKWMNEHLFPELRNAIAVVIYIKKPQEEILQPAESITSELSELPDLPEETEPLDESTISDEPDMSDLTAESEEPIDSIIPMEPKHFYMSVKTNMLYDALLVPNLGAEFYVGKHISLYGEWMYAWWDSNRKHRYWRTYGGNIGLRWWLGKKAKAKPLTGHHIGVYGGTLIFDFEWGNTGYMGGKPGGTLWDRCLINAGIEYGYSHPIGKRFNIDFSIGIGYLGGNYIKYYPFDNEYYRQKEYKMRYFGPTKAEISLVWLIGRGNTNKKKGGDE